MKNRQFRVLVILIIAQTFLFYFKFQEVKEKEDYILSTATFNWADLTHIRNTTDFIQEITAKHINWID